MGAQETRPERWIEVRRLGRVPYDEGLSLQADLVQRRRRDAIPDQLLLLEHPHVITLGSGSDHGHVLASESRLEDLGVAVLETGRGGDVTYHGPGQLVGYPILSLAPDRKDIHRYLRDLEEVLMRVLSAYGVEGQRIEGSTGVWTSQGKVAAIGVRVSSGWITSHGFAINVSTDLDYFENIIPCGLDDRRVTSLDRILGRSMALDEVMDTTVSAFASVFDRTVAYSI